MFPRCRSRDDVDPAPPLQDPVQVRILFVIVFCLLSSSYVPPSRSASSCFVLFCLLSLSFAPPTQTYVMQEKGDIDPDVFKSMSSLGCFKDKHALVAALLSPE